ncbi:hypothetical protein D3C74_442510 [compost metagenome]
MNRHSNAKTLGGRNDLLQEVTSVLPHIVLGYIFVGFKQTCEILQSFRFPARHCEGGVFIDFANQFQWFNVFNFASLIEVGC